jgi:hypothetical protein
MITNFKIFEDLKNKPEIGDYIIINVPNSTIIFAINNLQNVQPNIIKNFYNYVNNTIGTVACYFDHFNKQKQKVEIFYDNIPNEIINYFDKGNDNKYSLLFESQYILAYSKTKKELKQIIKAKKYNI